MMCDVGSDSCSSFPWLSVLPCAGRVGRNEAKLPRVLLEIRQNTESEVLRSEIETLR